MGDQGFGALTDARPLCRESSPVLRFEHATWDELLQARGRNFRQQVRRFPRKLGELGTVSYRLAADPDRLQRNLDTLFALHRARWEGAETPFLQAAAFHREFAAQALAKEWLRLWFLEVSGRLLPAARPTTSPSRPPTPPREVGPAAGRRGPCSRPPWPHGAVTGPAADPRPAAWQKLQDARKKTPV
jgi:hypothetical protein